MVTAPPTVSVWQTPPTVIWKGTSPWAGVALEPCRAMPPEPPTDWATTPQAKSPSVAIRVTVAAPEPSCPSIFTAPPLPPPVVPTPITDASPLPVDWSWAMPPDPPTDWATTPKAA